MPMVKLTPTEQQALVTSIATHFDVCSCRPDRHYLCPGHEFLHEQDRMVTRVERLLYVRRTLAQWQAMEYTADCTDCKQPRTLDFKGKCQDCSVKSLLDTVPIPTTVLPW